jgi:hypothetical protein
VFFTSLLSTEFIDRRIGLASLVFGWLFWSFSVAYSTPEKGFDWQVFLLVLLFFPVMYPFCVLFLLGVVAMRHRLDVRSELDEPRTNEPK